MGKLDRAVGALCIGLAAFGAVAAATSMSAARSEHAWAADLAAMPSTVALVLALLASIPGFYLLFRKGAV